MRRHKREIRPMRQLFSPGLNSWLEWAGVNGEVYAAGMPTPPELRGKVWCVGYVGATGGAGGAGCVRVVGLNQYHGSAACRRLLKNQNVVIVNVTV